VEEMQELAADQDYAALHPLAIVAFLLGCASALAFVGAVLYIIPVLAIGVALRALAGIAASDGGRRGAGLARLGAALAVFCLVGAITRNMVDTALVKRQTYDVAQRWVDLLAADRLTEALELITPRYIFGLMQERDPEAEPPTDQQVQAFATKRIKRDELVQQLAALPQSPRLDVAAWTGPPVRDRKTTRIAGDFEVATSSSRLGLLKLYFARTEDFEHTGVAWRIDGWRYVPEQP